MVNPSILVLSVSLRMKLLLACRGQEPKKRNSPIEKDKEGKDLSNHSFLFALMGECFFRDEMLCSPLIASLSKREVISKSSGLGSRR